MSEPSQAVTVVIRRRVRDGHREDYEAWLAVLMPVITKRLARFIYPT